MISINKQVRDVNEPYHLNPRLKQVAKLLAQGLNRKEIAAKLSLTVNVIRLYTNQVYERLDVRDQLHLLLIMNFPLNSPMIARSRYESSPK